MQVIKKIAHISLAMLLLVSTMGVTLHKHYCMGELETVSVFDEHEVCTMDMSNYPKSAMECCTDDVEQYKVEDFSKLSVEIDLKPDMNLVAVISYLLVDLKLIASSSSNFAYFNYKPPLIDKDIPVLVQSFLI